MGKPGKKGKKDREEVSRGPKKKHLRRGGERRKNWDDDETKKFRSQLGGVGLRLEIAEGDGNCLFRALSDQLFGDDGSFGTLRRDIMDFEGSREAEFRPFVEDDEPWEDYISRMREDGEWGGNLELYAVAQLFRVHIVIHQIGPSFELLGPANAKKTLHLAFHGEGHYNSVRRADDHTVGVPPDLPHISGGQQQQKAPEEKPKQNKKIARSGPCPCGSGRPYKKCCKKIKIKPPLDDDDDRPPSKKKDDADEIQRHLSALRI